MHLEMSHGTFHKAEHSADRLARVLVFAVFNCVFKIEILN